MICLTDLVIKQVQSAALPKEWAALETMKARKYDTIRVRLYREEAKKKKGADSRAPQDCGPHPSARATDHGRTHRLPS